MYDSSPLKEEGFSSQFSSSCIHEHCLVNSFGDENVASAVACVDPEAWLCLESNISIGFSRENCAVLRSRDFALSLPLSQALIPVLQCMISKVKPIN